MKQEMYLFRIRADLACHLATAATVTLHCHGHSRHQDPGCCCRLPACHSLAVKLLNKFPKKHHSTMSRKREAPPKPEELIQKLEEKFNDFKTSTETQFEEQEKVNEELKSLIVELKSNQEVHSQEINSKFNVFCEEQSALLEKLRYLLNEFEV